MIGHHNCYFCEEPEKIEILKKIMKVCDKCHSYFNDFYDDDLICDSCFDQVQDHALPGNIYHASFGLRINYDC